MPVTLEERKEKIVNYIQNNRENMYDALRQALEIPSYSDHREGSNAVVEFLLSLIPELDAKVSRLDGGSYVHHLLLESHCDAKPCIFFVGHVDTVFSTCTEWPFSQDHENTTVLV